MKKKSMANFFNLSLIYGFGFLFLRGISFLLLPVYTNLLSPFDAGIVFILYTILAFLNPIFAGGLDSALFKFYNSNKYSKENVISTSIILLFFSSFSISLLLILISQTSIVQFVDVSYNWLFMLSIVLFCDSISARALVVLRLKEKAWYYLFIGLINIISSLFFNVLFIAFCQLSSAGALYALIATSIIQFIAVLPVIISQVQFNRVDFTLYKKMLFFGLPFVPATILFITIGLIDRFFIEAYLGLSEVGVYSAGYKFGSLISIIIIAFNLNWQPYYLKIQNEKNFSTNIKKISQIFAVILLYVAAFMCVFSSDLFQITVFGVSLIGKEFWNSSNIIPWIAFGYFFYGLYVLQAPSLYIKNKQNWTPVFWGCGTIVNILLNIVLIPKKGISGAAIATFYSYVFMFLFIKIKNQTWMRLPLLGSILVFHACITVCLLFLKYANMSLVLVNVCFVLYTVATVWILAHIKKNRL
tara:strand:+ start:389 stop:1801 length:1413 start_codon:yes stop_codon:yes gene_type:complete